MNTGKTLFAQLMDVPANLPRAHLPALSGVTAVTAEHCLYRAPRSTEPEDLGQPSGQPPRRLMPTSSVWPKSDDSGPAVEAAAHGNPLNGRKTKLFSRRMSNGRPRLTYSEGLVI